MKSMRWVFAAVLFGGCAYQIIDLSVASSAVERQTIRPISRNELNMMRSGNVVVVNTMENCCRDVLVFNGTKSLNNLIVRDRDGLPAIDYYNIGRFSVAPASGGDEKMYGEILVGTFLQNQQFTLLITTQSTKDGCRKVICEPQIYHGQIHDSPLGERYRHPVGKVIVDEMAYNIINLPNANISSSSRDTSIVSNALSIDEMLKRGLHRPPANR
mgnify:CR=1 FL=1